jgi:hypothetical protein
VDTWHATRPFWWGIVLLMDRDATDIPEVTDSVVSSSDSGVAIKVLHAQDVDLGAAPSGAVMPTALVNIRIRTGVTPPPGIATAARIDVPSGVLTVGDAEQEHALEIGPGRWVVHVNCAPAEFAETVDIWLQKG